MENVNITIAEKELIRYSNPRLENQFEKMSDARKAALEVGKALLFATEEDYPVLYVIYRDSISKYLTYRLATPYLDKGLWQVIADLASEEYRRFDDKKVYGCLGSAQTLKGAWALVATDVKSYEILSALSSVDAKVLRATLAEVGVESTAGISGNSAAWTCYIELVERLSSIAKIATAMRKHNISGVHRIARMGKIRANLDSIAKTNLSAAEYEEWSKIVGALRRIRSARQCYSDVYGGPVADCYRQARIALLCGLQEERTAISEHNMVWLATADRQYMLCLGGLGTTETERRKITIAVNAILERYFNK